MLPTCARTSRPRSQPGIWALGDALFATALLSRISSGAGSGTLRSKLSTKPGSAQRQITLLGDAGGHARGALVGLARGGGIAGRPEQVATHRREPLGGGHS